MNLVELKREYLNGKLTKNNFIDKMYALHSVLFEYKKYLKNTDIKGIEISDNEIIMTTRSGGIKMVAAPYDKRIIPIEILNFEQYENDVLKMMKKLTMDSMTFFDVGGNAGWYTLNLSKEFAQSNFYVFEPIPNTFNVLMRNVELNDLPKENIHLYNFGISNEDTEIDFYFYKEGSGNASLANLSENNSTERIKGKVRKLDSIVKEFGVGPDLIKVDVEGAELFVFQGGLETLAHYKPIVFSEMLRKWASKFNYHPNEIIKLFCRLGYSCFTTDGQNLIKFETMDEETIDTNFFFLHNEKHNKLILENRRNV